MKTNIKKVKKKYLKGQVSNSGPQKGFQPISAHNY